MNYKEKQMLELELSLTNPSPEKLEEFIYILKAENEKLREALEEIKSYPTVSYDGDWEEIRDIVCKTLDLIEEMEDK
jgi:hypothetical protein